MIIADIMSTKVHYCRHIIALLITHHAPPSLAVPRYALGKPRAAYVFYVGNGIKKGGTSCEGKREGREGLADSEQPSDLNLSSCIQCWHHAHECLVGVYTISVRFMFSVKSIVA